MADKRSPVASLLADESPKMVLNGGLFDHLPEPGHKSFEQEEPSWMSIVKPGEKKL